MAELTTGSVPVPGAELRFDRSGRGPVVIFAHGLSASRANDLGGLLDFSPVVDADGHGDHPVRRAPGSGALFGAGTDRATDGLADP